MASITGKIYSTDSMVKAWKNYRLRIDKYLEVHVKDLAAHGQEYLERWEYDVKKALGVQLAPHIWKNRRRRPNPGKLFPYRNTGRQQESVSANVKMNVTGNGYFSITGWGEIGVPYAVYTNEGRPARSDGTSVGWEGWVDDIIDEHGRGDVIMSISDIFDELTMERVIMKDFMR